MRRTLKSRIVFLICFLIFQSAQSKEVKEAKVEPIGIQTEILKEVKDSKKNIVLKFEKRGDLLILLTRSNNGLKTQVTHWYNGKLKSTTIEEEMKIPVVNNKNSKTKEKTEKVTTLLTKPINVEQTKAPSDVRLVSELSHPKEMVFSEREIILSHPKGLLHEFWGQKGGKFVLKEKRIETLPDLMH